MTRNEVTCRKKNPDAGRNDYLLQWPRKAIAEIKENGYKKVIFKSVYSEKLCCPPPFPIFNCVNYFFFLYVF